MYCFCIMDETEKLMKWKLYIYTPKENMSARKVTAYASSIWGLLVNE